MMRSLLCAGVLSALALTMVAGGCAKPDHDLAPALSVARGRAPTYLNAATRYNATVEDFARVFVAGAVVRIDYTDENGERQNHQVDFTLQMVRPTMLALNIRKVGQSLFWLGCDDTRYWWFDFSKDESTAAVGRHDRFSAAQARRIGLAIHPLEVIRLLGVTPLAVSDGALGGTQWSSDGMDLGVTSALPGGGYVRVWLDPDTFRTRRIELIDRDRRMTLRAVFTGTASLQMRDQPIGPAWAERIVISHLASGSTLDLSIFKPTDGAGRISEKAFVFEELVKSLHPRRVIDLDAQSDADAERAQRAAAGAPRAPVPADEVARLLREARSAARIGEPPRVIGEELRADPAAAPERR
ncbi:hypothetical protein BH11PLA1_BH11PLA1_10620 [soil metagenome]